MVDGIALISCSFPEAKVHDGKKKLFLVLHRCPVSSNDTEQYQMIPAIPAIPTIPTIPGDTCAGSQTCNHRNWKKQRKCESARSPPGCRGVAVPRVQPSRACRSFVACPLLRCRMCGAFAVAVSWSLEADQSAAVCVVLLTSAASSTRVRLVCCTGVGFSVVCRLARALGGAVC